MTRKPPRVAVMLELDRGYARHIGIFAGIQAYARDRGWELFIDEAADESLPTRRTNPTPYDGVIARATRELARRAGRLALPVVNVWHDSPSRDELPGVFRDNAEIGRLCAEHLLSRGYVRFAGITSRAGSHSSASTAFRETLSDSGFPCSIRRIPIRAYQKRDSKQAVLQWLSEHEPPFGLYVCSDEVAYSVVQMCGELGLRVPEDVAVIGSANEVIFCEYCRPKLTSVDPGYERIGRTAAELLQRLLDGDTGAPRLVRVPPVGVVVRESTDFTVVADPLVASALSFIAANGHRPIGQNEVARAVGAEVRTLQNRFRKHLGRPIAREIRRLRIERAKRELLNEKKPVAEIARAVGFGTSAQMWQVFQREVGISPSAYRRRMVFDGASTLGAFAAE